MQNIADELDALFGFSTTWTATPNDGCWEAAGTIKIDETEVSEIISDAGVDDDARSLIIRFLMGHEKGHHLQDLVWPHRNYGTDHHAMEIEADLIGA